MFKNQLQELAQRSCFNLPSYGSIREGPDHAPRFKAFVNFNGEIFESPSYSSTLRQAEHYAAEAALNSLSSRGSKSLTARVLDETGVYKNLLQETAHKAGLNLPVYTTVRSGPGHVPVFTCTVELAGLSFNGLPSKTKKQAEKNAAIAAWSSLKKMTKLVSTMGEKGTSVTSLGNDEEEEEHEQVMVTRMLSNLISPTGSVTEGTQTKGRNHHQLHGIRRRIVVSGSRGGDVSMNIMNRNNGPSSSSSIIQYSSFSSNSFHQQQLFSSDNTKKKKKQNLATQSISSSSFIDLLPPPPPTTTSKILPLTSTSSSSLSGDHYRRRNWVGGNSKFIARRRRDRDSSSSSSSSPYLGGDHDHQDRCVLDDQQLCKRSQEDEKIATAAAVQGESSTSTSHKKPALLPLHSQQGSREQNHLVGCVSADQISCYSGSATYMRRNTYRCPSGFGFGSGFNPIRGIAPSVQIRSVIPVCASPPSAANHSNPSTQKLESEFSGKLKL